MSKLLSMLSQYEDLEMEAQYLTPLDLFHLASTNSKLYALMLIPSIFARLKRVTLCDGQGIIMRQEFGESLYELREDIDFEWGPDGRKVHQDKELEVRI